MSILFKTLFSQLTSLYKDILKSQSVKDITLSLISMIKISSNSAKESSVKLYKEISERFNLIQYKTIESITKEENHFGTFDDVCPTMEESKKQSCNLILGITFFPQSYNYIFSLRI